jgi:predicted phage tail protein
MSQAVGSTIIIDFNSAQALNFSGVNKSTDILFTQVALGEGPIYRINPNGPQDIEIDDKYIDDLVNFVTNNTKAEAFGVKYSTGTISPEGMSSFIPYSVVPVRFSSPITLKSGISSNPQIAAPPPTAVLFMPTNTNQEISAIDCIRFKFNVTSLQFQTNRGIYPTQLTLVALIHDRNQTTDFNQYIAGSGIIINELVDGGMNFDVEIKIPDNKKSTAGYRISVLKLTQDIAQDGFAAEVEFTGIDEIRNVQHNYPLTAVAGYAVKSSEFRTGQIPNYTSLIKGLIVDVPSNYNQPILPNGEVDWRQIEVPPSGTESAAVRGYRTQRFQTQLQYSPNINIYEGLWDGTYKKDWTENPVWIIKFLLTDSRLGMGLPEHIIDKFNFYTIARYCDAIDFATGNFVGVPGFSDGTFRFKPNGYLPEVENAILGLPEGTPIVERRFTCGMTISDNTTALDLIQAICSSFRATLVFKGNKLAFVIDRDSLYPEALFNETNIQEGSFSISGINEEELITGVEVSFVNFGNHFKRETIVLDTSVPDISRENRISIDAVGCTRKSQALRLAKYVLDSNRSKRRKVRFNTNSYGSDLYPGSIVAVSQKNNNLTYGYGGVVYSNAVPSSSNIVLEHITSPTITSDFFTANTDPIVLKIYQQNTGKLSHYIVDNSFSISTSSNSVFATDLVELTIKEKYDIFSNQFLTNSDNVFFKYDLWALGYINPSDLYSASSDKLFRVDTITVNQDGLTNITATEYNSNALLAIDSAAASLVSVDPTNLSFKTPPPPFIGLSSIPAKTNEGVIFYNLVVSTTTNTVNYNVPITTNIQYGLVDNLLEIVSVG